MVMATLHNHPPARSKLKYYKLTLGYICIMLSIVVFLLLDEFGWI